MFTQIQEFLGPPPSFQACPHLFDHPPPSPSPLSLSVRTQQLEKLQTLQLDKYVFQFSVNRILLQFFLFGNNIKKHSNEDNIRNDIITLCSTHSLLNTSRMKMLYTDILPNYLSKFHNYDSYNLFPSGGPHLANHSPPPARNCPLLPDAPPLNVQASFMDSPQGVMKMFRVYISAEVNRPSLKNAGQENAAW